jgi:hypothetical protein
LVIGKVNVLQVLSLVLKHTSFLKTGTVFKPCDVAGEHAGSASLKSAYEHILVAGIVGLNARHFCYWIDLPQSVKATTATRRPKRRYATGFSGLQNTI